MTVKVVSLSNKTTPSQIVGQMNDNLMKGGVRNCVVLFDNDKGDIELWISTMPVERLSFMSSILTAHVIEELNNG